MAYPVAAIIIAILLAALAALLAVLVVRRSVARKLALARMDLLSYACGAGGILGILPDSARMFAPTLMTADPAVWAALDNFKYLSFFLVSVSLGLGLARRAMSVGLEKRG